MTIFLRGALLCLSVPIAALGVIKQPVFAQSVMTLEPSTVMPTDVDIDIEITDTEISELNADDYLRQTFPATVAIPPSLPLSPGDRLRVRVPGLGGEEFSGEYEINFNGTLDLPFLEPILVQGLSPSEIEDSVYAALLQSGLFRAELLRVDIQPLDYSPVQITVSGAVFEPGRVLLARELSIQESMEIVGRDIPGGYPLERFLTVALKASGGVKPTADISHVEVRRGAVSTVVDLSGIFEGTTVIDFPLIAGDEVVVPDTGKFQRVFVKPSQITPDTIDLYISNLTEPGGSSSLEGDGNINVSSFQYGTNLAQVLVASGCVGGTRSTNAARRAVLIQSNRETAALSSTQYSISDLTRDESLSSDQNPLLMPKDAIACYDSRNTNIRGFLDTISNFLNPLNTLLNIFD